MCTEIKNNMKQAFLPPTTKIVMYYQAKDAYRENTYSHSFPVCRLIALRLMIY
jgi:hypothetical protein